MTIVWCWRTIRDTSGARSVRPKPPVMRPPCSPPRMTAVPYRGNGAAQPSQRRVSCDVEDEVIVAGAVGEVLPGVVDDVVSAPATGPGRPCWHLQRR